MRPGLGRSRWAYGGAVLMAALGVSSCHRIEGVRDVLPRMFLGATLDGGLVGIVKTDSLPECDQGDGVARFLPLAGHEEVAEQPYLTVDCARLVPLTPQELSRLLDGKGRFRGAGSIPENTKPLELGSYGYLRLPGEYIHTEYFLRYNQAEIRLVEWSSGNHWGGEVDHTYRVDLVDLERRIRTIRSRERTVELD